MNKPMLATICLFLSALCIAQTAPAPAGPANQPASDQAPVQNQHGRRGPGVAGTITAIAANSMTVTTSEGQTAQVTLSDKTEYRKDRQPAQVSDFKVGDNIFVRGEKVGDNAWQAEMVGARSGSPGRSGGPASGNSDFREGLGTRFIAGEIKSIEGTQLTIARPDGESQTISVDENTSFRKQGESVTLADFKPGDHVFGRGEMKNGVFVPAVLNQGEPRTGMQPKNNSPETH